MASNLNTKINSYAIENGIEFDQAFASPPTQTGTVTENTSANWSIIGKNPVYESTVGPPGGSGSWKYVGDASTGCRLRTNAGALLPLSADGDYSVGFWVKANDLRDLDAFNNSIQLFVLASTATHGFAINITGGLATFPYTISLTAAGTTYTTELTMDTINWYYFAVVKSGTNLNFYINNVLKQTRTNMGTAANATAIIWGDNLASSDLYSLNISNFYYASTSVIGTTQVAEIWTAGSVAPNATILETPATANALMVDPTLSISNRITDKINSYAIERGFEFNSAVTTPPAETGTVATSVSGDWTANAGTPVYQSGVGPLHGGGSWKFESVVGQNVRVRCAQTAARAVFNDREFTVGLWVNVSKIPSDGFEDTMVLSSVTNPYTAGVGFWVGATNATNNPSKFVFAADNFGVGYESSGITCNLNQWYFLAAIVNGTSTKYYINGIETNSITRTLTTNVGNITIGDATAPAAAIDEATFNVSNYFIAPNTVVTAADLLQIYNAGAGANITETPATASCLMVDPVVSVQRQINYSSTPVTASCLIVNPAVSVQRQINYGSTPATASCLAGDAAGDAVFGFMTMGFMQEPLYYLPGSLKDKIATYPIEYGVEFGAKTGSVFENVPIYGSRVTGIPTTNITPGGSGYSVQYSTSGPPASDAHSYLLAGSSTDLPAYNRTALSTVLKPIFQDFNYTIGFWFKMDSLPTGTSARGLTLARIRPSTNVLNGDFELAISGSSYPTNPSKLQLTFNGTNFTSVGPTLNTTDWHYVAVRRLDGTSINNVELYLDGQLVLTATNSDTALYDRFAFGMASATHTGSYNIQNLHMATSDALGPYEIGEIWLAGTIQEPATPVNAIYPPEPIYVNATIVNATFVATRPDSVNIATGIPVSILMVNPSISNSTLTRFNAPAITANATFPDRIGLDTFATKIIPAPALTATINLVNPLLPHFAFTASALLVNPVVSVAPNYLALVKNLNPLFYIQDGQSVPQQLGSWPVTSWEVDHMTTNVTSGEEMTSIGNGKSWQAVNPFNSAMPKVQAIVPNYNQLIGNLYATRSLTVECWYFSLAAGTNASTRVESGPIFTDGVTQIAEVFDWWQDSAGITDAPTNTHALIGDLVKNYNFVDEGINAFATWRTYYAQPKKDSWNHVAVTYEPLANPNQVRQKVYLNGSIISNLSLNIVNSLAGLSSANGLGEQNIYFPPAQGNPVTYNGPQIGWRVVLSGSQVINQLAGVKTDEFAIYDRTLSENQVYSHYTFVKNLSPNTDYSTINYAVSAQSGNHQVFPVQNVLYQESPFSALASRIPEPVETVGKSKNLSMEGPGEIQAELVDPIISLSINFSAKIIAVYAESNNHFVSNNTYYQYVQTNIAPYRYVNFDSSNSLLDHGSDNDYSVVPTSIGGTVVSHDLGINNKSAKTAGSNYTTDGVILKESEWNDTWNTGQASNHSAFWFQRAADDQSINGLRVLWNLNGYKDNQHVIVYQYLNKIHTQFNNGSGTWIEQDTGTLDLFDYNRHLVLIEFDHTNVNNNVIKVYVDAVLKSTISLGAYTGTTVNAATADSGPNFEQNSRARLGVGCLITPFASTALPVVPTNTKLIIDEIYWDKNSITQQQVTNLYNAMPAKTNTVNASDPLTGSSVLVMPAISSQGVILETFASSNIEIVQPLVSTNSQVLFLPQPITASALIVNSQRSDSIVVPVDFMLASAAFLSFGTPRLINAAVMEASFALQDRRVTGTFTIEGNGIRVNGIRTFDPITIWADYVTSSSFSEYIIPMKEVV